jgi:hypothetical protein
MSVEIKGVDVAALLADVNARLAEKRRLLVTDAEVREIAERPLEAVLDGNEFRSGLLAEIQAEPGRWAYAFDEQTLYRSSRGAAGRALEACRRALRPLQKLFWNPNPMIAALSRQSSLNQYYAHLLHNLAEELTRLRLEVQDLRNRNLQLQGRLELLARREKVFEELALGKPKAE